MITFILPGGSIKNKEWAEECAKKLEVDGTIRPVFWDHWDDPEAGFDKKEKADLISRHAKGDNINIIAKSIGTLVASYIIQQIPGQITKVIFNGICLNDIGEPEKETIEKALESLKPEKVLCFQNENDPHGTFAEVRAFLPESIKIMSKDRTDHEYPFFEDFNNFLTS